MDNDILTAILSPAPFVKMLMRLAVHPSIADKGLF